jgi:hypothetical protein
VAKENILQRIRRLVAESVRAGRYPSSTAALRAAGLSTGFFGELSKRLASDPEAGMTDRTAKALAEVLGVDVQTILSGETEASTLVDVYPERSAAVEAARKLQLPEAAIQLVLKENPGGSPSAMYWFRRIESEAERVSPTADSGSFKI